MEYRPKNILIFYYELCWNLHYYLVIRNAFKIVISDMDKKLFYVRRPVANGPQKSVGVCTFEQLLVKGSYFHYSFDISFYLFFIYSAYFGTDIVGF